MNVSHFYLFVHFLLSLSKKWSFCRHFGLWTCGVNVYINVVRKSVCSVVVIVCIMRHVTSTIEQWRLSLVCGQPLMIWNIVWCLPHWHLSLVTRPHFLWQDAQWPGLVRKWFIFDQYRRGRSNPGCWIVGASTRGELTTEANFQLSCHWLVTSIGWESVQRGLRDGRQLQEGEITYLPNGQSL